jgi:hypothetical protein
MPKGIFGIEMKSGVDVFFAILYQKEEARFHIAK